TSTCIAGCCGACTRGQLACQGAKYCDGGVGPAPAETCNGADDNCDGQIDEAFGAPLYNTDPNNCGACGRGCNLPHAVNGCHSDPSIDPSGHGVCYAVACLAGFNYVPAAPCGTSPPRDGPAGIGCNYSCPVFPPSPEICDGRDNDCNGAIDELKTT